MEVDSVRELHNLGKNLSFVRLLNLEGIPDKDNRQSIQNTDTIVGGAQVKKILD